MSAHNGQTKNGRTKGFALGFAVAVLCATPAFADDIELFVGQASGGDARPNILFILDTSGSMDTLVTTRPTYDPNTDYTGSCDDSRVYWRSGTGNPPSCGTDRWFNATALRCDAAAWAFDGVGFFTDRMAQWDWKYDERWERMRTSAKDRVVECRTDRGVHGDGSGNGQVYAEDGSGGPWAGSQTKEISWSGSQSGNTYTVYSANWLNWFHYGPQTTRDRLEIVQEVTTNLLDSISGVNVGLMRFNTSEGGPVIHPMEAVETARSALKSKVAALPHSGWTPLSETLYEAGQYYQGSTVDYGASAAPVASVAESRDPGDSSQYMAPINYSCQKNFIVLLTDGEPTEDVGANSKITGLEDFSDATGSTSCDGSGNGACLDDMAHYLFEKDLDDDLDGRQNVTTYTIGFAADFPLLESTANRGGGEYYTADDTSSLTVALTNIVTEILQDNTTFTAPTISVNAFNRTRNLNELFITVFQASDSSHWPGNLKKYFLEPTGQIIDVQGVNAVNNDTGFFDDNAESDWGGIVDGASVPESGAANQLPAPDERKLYTYLASTDLTAGSNEVVIANGLISDGLLNVGNPEDPTREELISWARGLDLKDEDQDNDVTDQRNVMGDPLHSKPASVIYGGDPGSPDITDAVVYSATNDGYLHAIDPRTGQELWAFIPPELIGNLKLLYEDDPSTSRVYGIDGSIRAEVVDHNMDGVIDTSASPADKVNLYFGMRRGGDFYYALDVSDKARPMVKWVKDNADFPDTLGQTWSTPALARVNISGTAQNTDKRALIFGGGYDTTQDNANYSTDVAGNSLYILDADSGNLLWRAGSDPGADLTLPSMNNAIPSDVRVLDINGDSFADRLYVGDMGGRVWRFDLFNGQTRSNFGAGGPIASLGAADLGGPTVTDTRRFYVAPDVVFMPSEGASYFNVMLGSGYRAHPLSTQTQDRFYALRDYRPFTAMTQAEYDALTPIADSDPSLINVTNDLSPTIPHGAAGWKLDLTISGEKVLSEARTFGNNVFFTTFEPGSSGSGNTNSCVPQRGKNRLYVVNATDGSPPPPVDGPEEEPTEEDRVHVLAQGGIAPEVVILFPDDPNDPIPDPACLVGLENCGAALTNLPVRTFWNQLGSE